MQQKTVLNFKIRPKEKYKVIKESFELYCDGKTSKALSRFKMQMF